MKACPGCGSRVSPKAPACPSCGHPLVRGRGRKLRIVGVLIMFSALPLMVFLARFEPIQTTPAIAVAIGGFAVFVLGSWFDS